MEFFLNILSHLWAILGVLATIYCYIAVRKSKFLVVAEKNDLVVTLNKGMDIKLNNIHLGSNLYSYRLVICYTGVKDIVQDDIKIPFTIWDRDKSCKWHNIKILKCSSTFKPKIKTNSNKLTIENQLVKTGDSMIIEFLLESKTNSLNYTSRIVDVAVRSSVYKINDGSYSFAFIAYGLVALFLSYLVSFQISSYLRGKERQSEYLAIYQYNDKMVNQKYQFKVDYTVDSLYEEDYFARNIPSIYFYENIPDTTSLNGRMRLLGEIMQQKNKFHEFRKKIDENKPSVRTKNLFEALKAKNALKWNYTYKLDNRIKVKFSNPKDFSWKDDGFELIFILFITLMVILSIFLSSYLFITFISIKRAYKMLK